MMMCTDVAWFRGPTLLEDDGELVEILRNKDHHILRLYDVQKSSVYSCTALNAYGEASHQFRLSLLKRKEIQACSVLLINMLLLIPGPDTEVEEEGEEESSSPMRCPFIEMDTEAEHIKVKDGQPVTFVCRVGGYPQPRLVFYKDDKRIRPNENIRIGTRLWLTNISYWPFLGVFTKQIYTLSGSKSPIPTHTRTRLPEKPA